MSMLKRSHCDVRRRIFAGVAIVLVSFLACAAAAADPASTQTALDRELQRLVRNGANGDPIAGAALAVMVGDRLVYQGAAGCAEFDAERGRKCLRPLLATSKMRVASISKMALAMGLETLIDEGRLDIDRDVSDYLGFRLENPAFPGRIITARQLLSHTSSIRDPEEYWLAAPGDFGSLFDDPAIFAQSEDGADKGPGAWFSYANFNYSILAAVIERLSGTRFDLFMTKTLFAPSGLDVGYNWSGVTLPARRLGAALAARDGKRWRSDVDGPQMLAGDLPYFLAEPGLDRAAYLDAYKPGDNPTLFSPQGGLRASVSDLALLASRLRGDQFLSAPVWSYGERAPNGDSENGFYRTFGLGVQTVSADGALLDDRTLVGHSGEAYGLHSGAWLIREKSGDENVSFAFALTGVGSSPPRGANPTFNRLEERLVRLAFTAADAARDASQEEPRPFDEEADAMQDVDAALLAAKADGKLPLLALGGNWCHDSRDLAKKFGAEPLRSVIDANYHVVWVDVGRRDRNLDVAKRFGVATLVGTPTIIILSPDGRTLNADSVHDWRVSASKSLEDATEYFESFAPGSK